MKWELIQKDDAFERRDGCAIITLTYYDEAIEPLSVDYYVNREYIKEFIDTNLGLKVGEVEEVNENVLIRVLAAIKNSDGARIEVELEHFLDVIVSPISIGFIHPTEGLA